MEYYLAEGFNEKGELQPYYQSNIAVANAQLQQAPEFIRGILLNERIQGKILMESGKTELIGIELSKEGIQHVFRGEMDNPTLQITGNEAAVVEILNADAPVDAAVKAINAGSITYGGVSAMDEVKAESNFAITTKLFLVNIASFMSGFLEKVYSTLS
ncbi:MAG: hypothetical protein IPJ89_03295 [Candidatus Iainarchaeum archaeon]|uniref:Uncharacterized protein n=1 Tax=Candidatus Iainarchaeum sp. TaxID=3101447 RepID=A0A7T9DIV0_9ARCH|nr:MAG: hypothetical protein IPJ89_03295 [Candidatus Diapherotrites archaeon]